MSIGPESGDDILITPALSNLLLEQDKYQANLSLWDKYLIWRYTLDSGVLTQFLIGNRQYNNEIWVRNFFYLYASAQYGVKEIPLAWRHWEPYLSNPKTWDALPVANKIKLELELIRQYAIDLERIILAAPSNKDVITVYRATGVYPDIDGIVKASQNMSYPQKITFPQDFRVFQKPFNSTSYDSQLDFSPFLGSISDCCLYKIKIPKCSRLLAISPVLHAYPHEREILLPFASTLIVHGVQKKIFNYYPLDKQKYTAVQSTPLVIGEVYRLRTGNQYLAKKEMRVFECEIETPLNNCEKQVI